MPWFWHGLDRQGLHLANTAVSTSPRGNAKAYISFFFFLQVQVTNLRWNSCAEHNNSPEHSNFFAGVVSRSLPSMPWGPAQRAMPGSLYPVLTQSDSQRRWQSQYSGLAPIALKIQRSVISNQWFRLFQYKSTHCSALCHQQVSLHSHIK